jgi:hypothetical protein
MPYISEDVQIIYDYHYYQMTMPMNRFLYKLEAVQSVDISQRASGRAVTETFGKTFYNTCNKQPTQVSKCGPNEQKFIDFTLFPLQEKL